MCQLEVVSEGGKKRYNSTLQVVWTTALWNDLGLFEKFAFQPFSWEHMEFKVQSIIVHAKTIEEPQLLKANPDSTFRDKYPDN